MPDSQRLTQPADPIHSKLLEADSELAAQEADLMAQLEAVQEKRQGLKTVMELFSSPDPPTKTASEPEPVAEVLTASLLELLNTTPTAESQTSPAPLQIPSKTPRSATRRRTTQSAKTKRAKQPSWQPYIRAEFGQTSLVELVVKILQREPIDYFGIPTMMQAIFVDEMPKSIWNQARNRVSNILAEGARKNKWYRDQAGQYSLSPAAMESSLL